MKPSLLFGTMCFRKLLAEFKMENDVDNDQTFSYL